MQPSYTSLAGPSGVVHARRPAVNSSDARRRQAGDLQGALDEIALLAEELRIRDGRIAMIDPHRRPYIRPIERNGDSGSQGRAGPVAGRDSRTGFS